MQERIARDGARQQSTRSRSPSLKHDPEKACPALDAGWKPVFRRSCFNNNLKREWRASVSAGRNLRERTFQLGERKPEIEKFDGHDPGAEIAAQNLAAARGFQRLRRVDIQKRAVPLDRDLRHRLIVLGNEVTGTDVAVKHNQFIEKTARPQDGIATPA